MAEAVREARKRQRRLEDPSHRPRPTDPREAFEEDGHFEIPLTTPPTPPRTPIRRIYHVSSSRTVGVNDGSSCWWDTYPFSGTPFYLPYSYDSIKDRYALFGYFCSIECAAAYLRASVPAGVYPLRASEFLTMLRRFYGSEKEKGSLRGLLCPDSAPPTPTDINRFGCAPPYQLLERFTPGGLSIEAFRELSRKNSYIVKPVRQHLPDATHHLWYHPEVVETSRFETVPFLRRREKQPRREFYRGPDGKIVLLSAPPPAPTPKWTRRDPATPSAASASSSSSSASSPSVKPSSSLARFMLPKPG